MSQILKAGNKCLSIGKTYYSVFGAQEKDLKDLDLKINMTKILFELKVANIWVFL